MRWAGVSGQTGSAAPCRPPRSQVSHSRDLEREADEYGMGSWQRPGMIRAKPRRCSTHSSLNRVTEAPSRTFFYGKHPQLRERIDTVDRVATRLTVNRSAQPVLNQAEFDRRMAKDNRPARGRLSSSGASVPPESRVASAGARPAPEARAGPVAASGRRAEGPGRSSTPAARPTRSRSRPSVRECTRTPAGPGAEEAVGTRARRSSSRRPRPQCRPTRASSRRSCEVLDAWWSLCPPPLGTTHAGAPPDSLTAPSMTAFVRGTRWPR
jgi:hypothetical protein